MKKHNIIAMIEVVARGLAPLKQKVIFVGGATVSLYLKHKSSDSVRPTDDVDCVVEVASRIAYADLQASMEKVGFSHSKDENAAICRMDFSGLKVNIMPSDSRILGFTNRCYPEGIGNAVNTKLPSGNTILIFSLPYFIATKIEAYFGRGQGDFRFSSDIEDIVTVLDGQKDFKELLSAPNTVKAYLKKSFRTFINDSVFLEGLSAHIDQGSDRQKRAERLYDLSNGICVTA